MRHRYKHEDNNVYLGEHIYISSRRWEMMQLHKPTIFLTELAVSLWTDLNLCNRTFDLTRLVQNIPGRSPVQLIEGYLLRLLISLYNDYLKRNNYTAVERMDYLLKTIYVIRHKIRDMRAEEKTSRYNNPMPNRSRRLRYNMI